jgi:hypothetical protein
MNNFAFPAQVYIAWMPWKTFVRYTPGGIDFFVGTS